MSGILNVTLISATTILVEVSFQTFQLLSGLVASSYNEHGFSLRLFRIFLFEHLPVAAKFFVKTFFKKLKDSLFDAFMNLFKTKSLKYLLA